MEPRRDEKAQVGLLLAMILVMTETGVIAFSGVLQEQGVIEDLAAQEVWVAEGGLQVQAVLLVLRSMDEAAPADEQG